MKATNVATRETSNMPDRITWAMPSDREMVASRIFDAPRRLVFRACTAPEHVRQWYGPRSHTVTACEIDLRPGGSFRYVLRAPDGSEHTFSGGYREIVEPERIVNTWRFEAIPGSDTLETATLEEVDGRTRMTVHVLFQSPEHYQGWAGSGGHAGMNETLDRLAELVVRMASEEPAMSPEEELVVARTFDAPRELLWKAWTEPERLAEWWGPKGLKMIFCDLDLRPGGTFLYGLRSPQGNEMWGKWTFREITGPERLVFTASFADADGNVVRAPFSEHWPLEVLSTVTFDEQHGRTALTMRSIPHQATAAERNAFQASHSAMQGGWTGTLNQLDAYLASVVRQAATVPAGGDTSDREIVLTRRFDAPRDLVFQAWTDPRQIGAWWGPNGFSTTTHQADVRPGGAWRFTMHGPDGTDYRNQITYQEITRPERLVYSHGDGESDDFTVTVHFIADGAGTRLEMRMLFASAADRDRTVEFGAVELGQQTLGRLAAHLQARAAHLQAR